MFLLISLQRAKTEGSSASEGIRTVKVRAYSRRVKFPDKGDYRRLRSWPSRKTFFQHPRGRQRTTQNGQSGMQMHFPIFAHNNRGVIMVSMRQVLSTSAYLPRRR